MERGGRGEVGCMWVRDDGGVEGDEGVRNVGGWSGGGARGCLCVCVRECVCVCGVEVRGRERRRVFF